MPKIRYYPIVKEMEVWVRREQNIIEKVQIIKSTSLRIVLISKSSYNKTISQAMQ